MRSSTFFLLFLVVALPVYALAQSAPGVALFPAGLKFELSEPRKVAPFPLVLNSAVRSYVDSYLAHSEGLRLCYRRSAPFLGRMTEMLGHYGIPPDMVYLAFAESSFTRGGSGPWQLTKATAQEFGLRIDKFVDERRDPIKSTRAAAEYLSTLHDEVGGDWRLAIVAWNTGETMMGRFVANHGEDFDRLLSTLPQRTRGLLNRFMAVAFIARNAKEYGLEDAVYTPPQTYALIHPPEGTPLSKVAKTTHTDVADVRQLNPALLCDRVPPGGYDVLIPAGRGGITRPAHIAP